MLPLAEALSRRADRHGAGAAASWPPGRPRLVACRGGDRHRGGDQGTPLRRGRLGAGALRLAARGARLHGQRCRAGGHAVPHRTPGRRATLPSGRRRVPGRGADRRRSVPASPASPASRRGSRRWAFPARAPRQAPLHRPHRVPRRRGQAAHRRGRRPPNEADGRRRPWRPSAPRATLPPSARLPWPADTAARPAEARRPCTTPKHMTDLGGEDSVHGPGTIRSSD